MPQSDTLLTLTEQLDALLLQGLSHRNPQQLQSFAEQCSNLKLTQVAERLIALSEAEPEQRASCYLQLAAFMDELNKELKWERARQILEVENSAEH